jgi:prevent-host-death family protein
MVTKVVMHREPSMQTLKAADFKAKCLALMDQVQRTGEAVLITKNGRPVAELHPAAGERLPSPFGLHRGAITIRGDILAPIDSPWNALAG